MAGLETKPRFMLGGNLGSSFARLYTKATVLTSGFAPGRGLQLKCPTGQPILEGREGNAPSTLGPLRMKIKTLICAITLSLVAGQLTRAADEIYVKMQGGVPAILSNGTEFTTENGDCFPFVRYDATQTLMQLKFGEFSFWTRKAYGEIVPDDGTAEAMANYRADVAKFPAAPAEEPARAINPPEISKAPVVKAADHADAFPVDAASDAWQNSGVRVKAGQHVLVEAADGETWDIGWGPTGAKGYSAPRNSLSGLPVYHEGTPNDDWHWGALICAVGDSRNELNDPRHEVEIGTKRGFTVDSDGYLQFIANDNRELSDGRNGFDDNSGIIHVKVTVTDGASMGPGQTEATGPRRAGFEPKYDLAGHWYANDPRVCSDTFRNGKHVFSVHDDGGYICVFEGDYVDDQTIDGTQSRCKRADGTVTRMRVSIVMQSPDLIKIDWVALDSNSDLREGQTGEVFEKRVNPDASAQLGNHWNGPGVEY